MGSFFIYQRQFNVFIVLVLTALAGISCSDGMARSENELPDANITLNNTDSASLHFFVIGDWGFNGISDQKKVGSAMSKLSKLVGLDFILTCGDNFQYRGVKGINDKLWYSNFENVYNDSSLFVPWYPALGNHDYRGDPDAEVEYSAVNKNWKMPGRYYTFVREINSDNSARFIIIDTYWLIKEYRRLPDKKKYDMIPQYSWLKNLLSGANEEWIIVTGHLPVFSTGFRHGDTKELIVLLKPLFDEYSVDFYFSGHDHDFEHSREKGKGTDYIVTGTGGSARVVGHNDKTVFSMSETGFTFISLAGDSAKLYFITGEGFIGYSYIKRK